MCCKKKKKKKNQSRIGPTGIVSVQMEESTVAVAVVEAAVEEEDVATVDKWRVSRLLFTIKEEDSEMEEEDDDVDNGGELQIDIPVEYSGEPTPFLTPCDSPPYFTPSPSPGRDMDDVTDVYDVVSSSSRGCCFNFQSSQMC